MGTLLDTVQKKKERKKEKIKLVKEPIFRDKTETGKEREMIEYYFASS